jgi:DNA polymerase-3 subunit gamma/tau
MLMDTAEKLQYSSQPRLLLETSFLKMIEVGNVVPVTEILEKLEGLAEEAGQSLSGAASPKPESAEKKTAKQEPAPADAIVPNPKKADKQQQEEVLPVKESTPQGTTSDPPPLEAPPPVVENQEKMPSIEGSEEIPLPPEPDTPNQVGSPKVLLQPHEKDVRKNWLEFIDYVREQKLWMAQDLQRADSAREEPSGELHLVFSDAANCSLLRQKENLRLLTELALDFFQKPLKVRFTVPQEEDIANGNGEDSPHKKRQQLANDPLVIMAAEIFNGQVADIRIGPQVKK